MRGIVEAYSEQEKFGFARCIGPGTCGRKRVICHKMDIINSDVLMEGDLIDFTVAEGDRDQARGIFVISKEI